MFALLLIWTILSVPGPALTLLTLISAYRDRRALRQFNIDGLRARIAQQAIRRTWINLLVHSVNVTGVMILIPQMAAVAALGGWVGFAVTRNSIFVLASFFLGINSLCDIISQHGNIEIARERLLHRNAS